MLPGLAPGDEVLVDRRAYRRQPPQPGDVVVTRHPDQPDLLMVKRVQEVDGHGRLSLIGDNPDQSSDSRVYGRFPPHKILGRVTSRLP